MQIEFTRNLKQPDKYFVTRNSQIILHADYNRSTETKELFYPNHALVARGLPCYTKRLQLSPSYMIQLNNGNEKIIIKRKSIWRDEHYFIHQENLYQLFKHFGTRCSVFKDYKQIASYYTNGANLRPGSGNSVLICDDNINVVLLCSVSLYLSSAFGSEDNSGYNVNPFAKKFNARWKPNSQ